jgi:signal transduction histidine kinase
MIWNITYTPAIWPSALTILLLITLSIYSLRRRGMPGALVFTFALQFAALWSAGSAMEVASVDLATKIFWFKFQAVWQLPAATAMTCFFLEYAWPERWLTRRNLALLSIAPLLVLGLFLSDNLHHWMLRGFILQDGSIAPQFGPGAWLAILYSFGLAILTLFILVWLFLHSPQHRWPASIMIMGHIGFRTLFLLETVNLISSNLPLDVIGLAFMAMMYAIALFGFRIFDPVHMARQMVIKQLHTGMLVLGTDGRVVSLNPAAEQILGAPARKIKGRPFRELLPDYPVGPLVDPSETNIEYSLGNGLQIRHYLLRVSLLKDWRGQEAGRLLMLRDVTEPKQAREQQKQQQLLLATLQERERLARELHDGLGQALAAAHLQASTAKLLLDRGETDKLSECLDNLTDTTLQAEADMREYLLGVQTLISADFQFFPTLREYVVRFTRQYSLPVELSVPPELEEQGLAQTIAVQLLRILQEGLSNVRKHARAHCAQINFTVSGTLLWVVLSDDGQGFNLARVETQKDAGFGLQSMRERAEALGGCLEMISQAGQGTQVVIQVPVGEVHGDTLKR